MKIYLKTKIAFLIFGTLFISMICAQEKDLTAQNLKILEQEEWKLVNETEELYFFKNSKEEAYTLSHKLLKTVDTDLNKSYLTCLISSYFLSKGSSDSAIYYAKKSLSYKNFSNDSTKKQRNLKAVMNLANGYQNKGLMDDAKKMYFDCIEKAERWGQKQNYYGCMFNLGNSYYLEENYQKALPLLEKCIKSDIQRIKVNATISLGSIYGDLKNFKKSNNYYYDALANIKNNDRLNLGIRVNLAENLMEMGKKKQAILELKKIIKESKDPNLNTIKNYAQIFLIDVYIKEKKYRYAEQLLIPIVEQDKKEGNLSRLLGCYGHLKEIAKGTGDYQKALIFSDEYAKINDSIKALQKTKDINELEVKFETAKKEKEIELLKKDQELHESKIEKQALVKNTILITSILIIIPILLLLYVYYQNLKTQKTLNTTQQQVNKQVVISIMKDQELKLIKASIEGQDKERKRVAQDLHDAIGSNMAAIKLQLSTLSLTSSKLTSIKRQLDDTSEQIRELSHNLLPKKIRQNEFTILLKEYLNNIDEAAGVEISFIVSQEKIINNTNKVVQNEIFAILQELVTNTIKHSGANNIIIQLEVAENRILLIYEDNGKGFDITLAKSNGIGLKSIQNRIDELTGSFNIDPHPKRGTLVEVEIPIVFQTN